MSDIKNSNDSRLKKVFTVESSYNVHGFDTNFDSRYRATLAEPSSPFPLAVPCLDDPASLLPPLLLLARIIVFVIIVIIIRRQRALLPLLPSVAPSSLSSLSSPSFSLVVLLALLLTAALNVGQRLLRVLQLLLQHI